MKIGYQLNSEITSRLSYLAYVLRKRKYNFAEFGVPFDREIEFERLIIEDAPHYNCIYAYTTTTKYLNWMEVKKELDCIDLLIYREPKFILRILDDNQFTNIEKMRVFSGNPAKRLTL